MNQATAGRILIVDDEAAHMEALCHTLSMEGYLTRGHSSPRQALENLREGEVDVVLTDLMMPGMDGISLLRAARKVDANLAGIVMTGHGTIDTAVQALQDGALDYVLKPFKLSILLPVIGRALQMRQLRLEHAAMHERERHYIEELEAANRDLDAFSCSVSHDLRAPLRAVTSFCEMYMEQCSPEISVRGRELLDRVLGGARRMDVLIEDLLAFCRFSRQPLCRSRVDVGEMVRSIVAELRACDPDRALDVRIGALPTLEADASLLALAFTNLLSNALKFTRGRTPALVEVGYEQSSSTFFVRDNGAGFDMQYVDRLFGVFQRLHSSQEFEGTGVGLSIVQRIIQRHGGQIRAHGVPGEGATFRFTLQTLPQRMVPSGDGK